MKYWNSRRLDRIKGNRKKCEGRAFERYLQECEQDRSYSKGDRRKNARLMLEALANPLHRRMLARLRMRGAMSVSHIAETFRIMLPAAMRHVHTLERVGLITTRKNGRVRFCIYNPEAARELAVWFSTSAPFDVD